MGKEDTTGLSKRHLLEGQVLQIRLNLRHIPIMIHLPQTQLILRVKHVSLSDHSTPTSLLLHQEHIDLSPPTTMLVENRMTSRQSLELRSIVFLPRLVILDLEIRSRVHIHLPLLRYLCRVVDKAFVGMDAGKGKAPFDLTLVERSDPLTAFRVRCE